MPDENRKFTSYQYSEGKTAIGQQVEFTCASEEVDQVKAFLREHVRSIDIPSAHRVGIAHGGYGRYSRYKIKQHKYAGGGYPGSGGFIEVLEIENPPDGRSSIVLYEQRSNSVKVVSNFTEWETLEHAIAAWDVTWGKRWGESEKLRAFPGFRRWVECGYLTPWFYALDNQELLGDYAFPDGFSDDPFFSFGRKFVVESTDEKGKTVARVKTCMGCRFYSEREYDGGSWGHRDEKMVRYRLVHWDDGTLSRIPVREKEEWPSWCRPLHPEEAWVSEAIDQFWELLTGNSREFTIQFTDGNKFVGKFVPAPGKQYRAAGEYYTKVQLEGEEKILEGRFSFTPTPDAPNVVSFLTQRYAKNGKRVLKIEGLRLLKQKGKKWLGSFFARA